jgi:hypothetical protein
MKSLRPSIRPIGRPWAMALVTLGVASASALAPLGCGDVTDSTTVGVDGGTDANADPVVETLYPSGKPLPGFDTCEVVITTNIVQNTAEHRDVCTPLEYETNPPSGGNHWNKWAAFGIYEVAVPREMYVHDMEHGAVVLAYDCADACPEVVDALSSVYAGVAADPLCISSSSVNARLLLTPDPKLDTPIAAAAWGATYTATCIDLPSLEDFVSRRYGRGTEATCAQGVTLGDAGVDCTDGGTGVGGSGQGGHGP